MSNVALSVDLSGTTSIVVGGNQGIGLAIAEALAKSGSNLVIAARNQQRLKQARERIQASSGADVLTQSIDVTSPADIDALAEVVLEHSGSPTILINGAGGSIRKKAFDVTVDDWDVLVDTHVRGTFFACQTIGRLMAEAGYGKIINMSSTWATSTAPERSVYATAKAAVSHMTAALAVEWATLGIRVNAIAPTTTKTPRVLSSFECGDASLLEVATARIPLGRLAEPEDIVGAALFLSSPSSDFITGQTLYVDGGWSKSK